MKKVDKIFNSLLSRKIEIPSGYITDGLVFRIDGLLDSGVVPTDLVGSLGITFSVSIGTAQRSTQDNGWKFDGSTILVGNRQIGITASQGTIEVVLKDNNKFGRAIWFQGGSTDAIMAGTDANKNLVFGCGTKVVSYVLDDLDTCCVISANTERAYQTAQAMTIGSNLQYSDYGTATIGGRLGSASKYPFTGEIYAIRIYNRKLTQAEILYNQALDIERFEIGEYTYYDYLESDGNGQYIDTGVYVGGQSGIEIDDYSTSESISPVDAIWICGARNSAWNAEYNFRFSGAVMAIRYATQPEYRTLAYTVGARYNYSRHKNVVLITDQWGDIFYSNTFGNRTTTPNYTFLLFAMHNASIVASEPHSQRMGYVRIYDDNDILVRDFRPAVRIADGVAGMHDVLNDVFYTNANPAGDNFLYGNLT